MAPVRGSACAGPTSGAEPGRGGAEGVAADVGQGSRPAIGQRPVEKGRQPQLLSEPAGETVTLGHRGGEVLGGRGSGRVGDEGHHVEHTEAGMDPAVLGQVEGADRGPGQRAGGVIHQVSRPDRG